MELYPHKKETNRYGHRLYMKLLVASSWSFKIWIKNMHSWTSSQMAGSAEALLLGWRLVETGVEGPNPASEIHVHWPKWEMPCSIYSGGIIHSQSRPVCSDKTKKIPKNVLHVLLRVHEHELNSHIELWSFDQKRTLSCLTGPPHCRLGSLKAELTKRQLLWGCKKQPSWN